MRQIANIKILLLALVLPAAGFCMQEHGGPSLQKPGKNDLAPFLSDRYVVLRKNPQGKLDSIPVYISRAADEGPQREWGKQKGKRFHYVNLTIAPNQAADLQIYKIGSKAGKAAVRPTRLGYRAQVAANAGQNAKATLRMTKASKVSVEFNDDPRNIDPLLIFANNPEKQNLVPDLKDASVLVVRDSASLKNIPPDKKTICFRAGLTTIGRWTVPRHVTQIYIPENAIVRGYIECNRNGNAPAITVNGRGILTNLGWPYHYPSTNDINPYEHNSNWYKALFVYGGSGHLIEGITITDATAFVLLLNASNSRISNVKINGFRFNNDAVTVMGRNIAITDCFLRVNDDAIVPNVKDSLNVSECVFWQLQAGSIFQFGWTPHSLKNVKISNCDVLHAEWEYTNENSGFINAMGMMKNNDDAVVEDVSVRNIYFDTPVTRFLDVQNTRKSKRNEAHIGRGKPWIYKNCTFDNIHFNEPFDRQKTLVYFSGFSDQFPSESLSFTNFHFQGRKLNDSQLQHIINAKNLKNLKIR
ncbi:Glycosyl hydrolase family 49 [Dyadobacter soli]|uniref:Glycosyl hydrolase family 49 n=1 Tax=Dyadobacter soli TaxID=659014 RepID=A0A1G6YDN1_9BACT|nr:hypothetical protein [Dyadobacter soli]SDD87705.1 Glycosyl hydrolase family 49 [Dyadobacter soli]